MENIRREGIFAVSAMSSRNKLQKFAELLTFPNVVQNFDPKQPGLVGEHGLPVERKGRWASEQFGNANRPWKRAEQQSGSGWRQHTRASNRGAFGVHDDLKFRDILDGLSNTIAMGEIATDLGDNDIRTIGEHEPTQALDLIRDNPKWCADQGYIDPARPTFWLATIPKWTAVNGRGYRWADHRGEHTGMHTILPPNAEICAQRNPGGRSICPPSSRHQGGVHILMADGAVVFMTDSVEAGDSRSPQVWLNGMITGPPSNVVGAQSPYGLWGALGTRAAKETVDVQLNQ